MGNYTFFGYQLTVILDRRALTFYKTPGIQSQFLKVNFQEIVLTIFLLLYTIGFSTPQFNEKISSTNDVYKF